VYGVLVGKADGGKSLGRPRHTRMQENTNNKIDVRQTG
jgi:hypothetical protein